MDKATELNLTFALNSYENRSLTDSISIATEELKYKFMSIQNYREAVNNSDLVDQRKSRNDFEFEEEYPDHPLAGKNSHRRIIAGDFFWYLSGAVELSQIPTDTIKLLEQSLYDCCAAVRLRVVQALGRWRSKDSLNNIIALVELENESKMVKGASEEAIIAINDNNFKLDDSKYLQNPAAPFLD